MSDDRHMTVTTLSIASDTCMTDVFQILRFSKWRCVRYCIGVYGFEAVGWLTVITTNIACCTTMSPGARRWSSEWCHIVSSIFVIIILAGQASRHSWARFWWPRWFHANDNVMAMCVCQWGRRWPDILHSIVSLCWVLYVEALRSIQMSIDADFLWSSSVVRWFVAVEHWVLSAGYSWNLEPSSVAETHQRDGLGPLPWRSSRCLVSAHPDCPHSCLHCVPCKLCLWLSVCFFTTFRVYFFVFVGIFCVISIIIWC